MSTQEHIYLLADATPEAIARRLAPAAGLSVKVGGNGEVHLSRPARLGPGEVGGEVYRNDGAGSGAGADPGAGEMLDAFPLVFEVGYTGRDPGVQLAEAARLFTDLAAAPPVPMAFVHGFDFLVAVADAGTGLVWMPEGTTPYPLHRELWQSFLARSGS